MKEQQTLHLIWEVIIFCLRLLIPGYSSSYSDHVARLAAAKTGAGLQFLAPYCTRLTKSMASWRRRTQSQVDCLQRSPWGTKTSAVACLLCSKSQKCVHLCFLVYLSESFEAFAQTFYYFILDSSDSNLIQPWTKKLGAVICKKSNSSFLELHRSCVINAYLESENSVLRL